MHATLAFSALPLFAGALLSDWAYAQTEQVQWTNFAAWLIAGGLLMAGMALMWGAVDMLRRRGLRNRSAWLPLALLLAAFVLAFVNALVHAQDAWAAMPSKPNASTLVQHRNSFILFKTPQRPRHCAPLLPRQSPNSRATLDGRSPHC